MFSLLERRKVDAEHIVGNAVIGDISGTLIQNFHQGAPPSPPRLIWTPLPNDEDVFRLLQWRTRLTPLVGRDRERAELLSWARTDHQGLPRLRLLTGPGGAGKSRLAAEAAQMLKDEGWIAGFHGLDKPAIMPVPAKGLFMILDYPEEAREATVSLLRELATQSDLPAPICLLLLSRQPEHWWQRDVDAAHADHLCDAQEVGVAILNERETCAAFQQAARRLRERYRPGAHIPPDEAVIAWRARNLAVHGLPLFVCAAAVHAVLDEEPTLELRAERIVQALVRREKLRLDNVSRLCGLGNHGGTRLVALAALPGSLRPTSIRRLADPLLELGLPPPEHVVDLVSAFPWWRDGQVPAPSPDIVGAALLLVVLAERPEMAPEWLWAAIGDSANKDLVARLDRLAYDLMTLHGAREQRLATWLAGIVAREPARAKSLGFLAWTGSVGDGARSLAIAVIQDILARGGLGEDQRARLLGKLSNRLAEAGDPAGARTASEEAVGLYRRLAQADPARFEPDLALILSNHSISLAEAGDSAGARAASKEAVSILSPLAQANPARFEPDLALILNNLSIDLAEAGDSAGARTASEEAVELYRRLARASPARFEHNLARSLHNLSMRLGEAGDSAGACAASKEAVAIFRRLVEANPARFEPDLARSLHVHSISLAEAGDSAGARTAIEEAVGLYRYLAEANPVRFEPSLAETLNKLWMSLIKAGDRGGAGKANVEAVAIFRRLAHADPARFEPRFGLILNIHSLGLAAAGDSGGARKASEEAVAIFRRLAQTNPARFEPDLARSLDIHSIDLAEAGDSAGARTAIEEAVGLYRRLVDTLSRKIESVHQDGA